MKITGKIWGGELWPETMPPNFDLLMIITSLCANVQTKHLLKYVNRPHMQAEIGVSVQLHNVCENAQLSVCTFLQNNHLYNFTNLPEIAAILKSLSARHFIESTAKRPAFWAGFWASAV